MQRNRAGFTLIELLVASGVFLIGFVAVFGLFLAGIRFRKLSDDTARSALAASSLVSEIRIDAGREGAPGPRLPDEYVGDGYATGANPDAAVAATTAEYDLFQWLGQPGIWYRIETCANPMPGPLATDVVALRMSLVVIPWAYPEPSGTLTLERIDQRLLLGPGRSELGPDAATVVAALIQRGLAFRYDATIVREPNWRGP